MLNTTIDLPQHNRIFQFWNNDSRSSDIHKTCNSDKNIAIITKVREIHLELIKCARNINDAYGLHILMSISTSFIFYHTLKIFIICYVCASTATEATNTGDILCELHEPSTSMEFRQEVYNFTLQLVQNPLSFTACAFFDLNNRLIYGLIGIVTTYLVILIQIGSTASKNIFENSTVPFNN
ncbi:PREDICTED: gustatory receptor 68a-like [Polistes canadensis]|uniref:gustatory receptor 68a-like n=1 Tax=Polistes canadensis TaxID=91411 RepID=UPI000718C166|nr:PREDICTED: gustatory receptor 68a-like [Polistes canadensis]